jgi:hypothetical protein
MMTNMVNGSSKKKEMGQLPTDNPVGQCGAGQSLTMTKVMTKTPVIELLEDSFPRSPLPERLQNLHGRDRFTPTTLESQ